MVVVVVVVVVGLVGGRARREGRGWEAEAGWIGVCGGRVGGWIGVGVGRGWGGGE